MIRPVIGIIFMVIGLFVLTVATYGIFKFKYVLNRMHSAALVDTLGVLCFIVGLIVFSGITIESLKMGLIIIFIWLTGPVATHLIAKTEVLLHDSIDLESGNIEKEVDKNGNS